MYRKTTWLRNRTRKRKKITEERDEKLKQRKQKHTQKKHQYIHITKQTHTLQNNNYTHRHHPQRKNYIMGEKNTKLHTTTHIHIHTADGIIKTNTNTYKQLHTKKK